MSPLIGSAGSPSPVPLSQKRMTSTAGSGPMMRGKPPPKPDLTWAIVAAGPERGRQGVLGQGDRSRASL